MGDTTHSPGPWKACGACKGRCTCGLVWSIPADRAIAQALAYDDEGNIDPETRAANMVLIARAPEMADEIDRLRRDLATRDRELAEAREYETAALKAGKAFFEELNKARAALAEKEREAAELRAERDQLKRQWAEWVNKAFAGKEALAAAQEEAKGLRAWLINAAMSGCEGGDLHSECGDVCVGHEPCDCWPHKAARRARRALAARQQQPAGKPDSAPVASEMSRPSPFCNAPLSSGGQCGYLRGHLPPCGARRPERKDRP